MTDPSRQPTLRGAGPADRDLLLRVYASTRADEMALVDWTDDQRHAFVEMQFTAQDRHYREHYPGASFDVVMVDGEPVGRLYVDRRPAEIRVVDIALLTDRRNQGLGSLLLGRIMDEAAATGRKVSIHVETFNPALRLYQRLGFRPVAERGVHLLMEWEPANGAGQAEPPPARGLDIDPAGRGSDR